MNDNLPPLPPCAPEFKPRWPTDPGGYNKEQMQAYARAAIERHSVPIQCEREAFETWASRQQGFGCAANPVDYTLGATRDAWEVWQARAAIDIQSAPATQDAANLLDRFERQWHRMGELWERCQGKGWPDAACAEFESLRDEKSPATRAALLALLAAAPQPQPVQQEPIGVVVRAAAELGKETK